MTTYILVDGANMYFKSRHVASRMSTPEDQVGMALHLTFSSVQSVVRRFAGNDDYHVVFCTEGRSWRKDFHAPYKANRTAKRDSQTPAEAAVDKMFWDTYSDMTEYLKTKTNISVLRCPIGEADDLIARMIHLHPDDTHYIISSDSDFHQLIAPNVKQFNGIADQLITLDGYFDSRGRNVKDTKTSQPKQLGDPQWQLFQKIMRGDTSDNVFSAYPGVRTKSTKKTVGLTEAFADRNTKGFNWNSMMLSRWTDHNGLEHRVLDDYNRNVTLIDLTAQPEDIKRTIDASIVEGLRTEPVTGVGIHFMRFCGRHNLEKLGGQAESFARWLNKPYSGHLKVDTANV